MIVLLCVICTNTNLLNTAIMCSLIYHKLFITNINKYISISLNTNKVNFVQDKYSWLEFRGVSPAPKVSFAP